MNFSTISAAIALALPSVEKGNDHVFTTGGYTTRLHKEDGQYWVNFTYNHLNHQHGGNFDTIEQASSFLEEAYYAEEDQFPSK
jgi:hypothetical protein